MANTFICVLDIIGSHDPVAGFLAALAAETKADRAVDDQRPWVASIAEGSTEGIPDIRDRADGQVTAGLVFGANGETPFGEVLDESTRHPGVALVVVGLDSLTNTAEAKSFLNGQEIASHEMSESEYDALVADIDEGPTEEEEGKLLDALIASVSEQAAAAVRGISPSPR